MKQEFFNEKPYAIFSGKMEERLTELLLDNSIDACVSDPPYNLGFMGKAWDKHKTPLDFQLWFQDKAQHVYRVLKPGAYFVCFGGTRTFHRMTSAIEDAGFEIRDCMGWLYGSGFPKSHNGEWGGTALKPAWEPIIVARKPIDGSVKENFEKWGTGGIDIDAGRISLDNDYKSKPNGRPSLTGLGDNYDRSKANQKDEIGRWPANIVHDGSEEVIELFPYQKSGAMNKSYEYTNTGFSLGKPTGSTKSIHSANEGSAARFFYCAKASREDRNEGCEFLEAKPSGMVSNTSGQHITRRDGYQPPQSQNNHPTVKPTSLMRWLIRMFVPKDGICLDPFNGSGSTGKAAMYEFRNFIGIDMDFDLSIAQARIEFAIRNRSNQLPLYV